MDKRVQYTAIATILSKITTFMRVLSVAYKKKPPLIEVVCMLDFDDVFDCVPCILVFLSVGTRYMKSSET